MLIAKKKWPLFGVKWKLYWNESGVYNVIGQKFQNVEKMSVTDGLPAKRIDKLNNSEKKNC